MSAVPQLVHDVFRSALEDPIECRLVAVRPEGAIVSKALDLKRPIREAEHGWTHPLGRPGNE
jgi:hypothetical protein